MDNKMISRAEIAKYSGLSWKDYMFYSLGDFGICLVFQCANALLSMYYNDCLLFNPVYVIIIFLIARIWDAVNDPMMGRLADKMKANKRGKYKRWLLYMAAPFAIATVLMFMIPGGLVGSTAPWWQYVLAGFTYILFGMCMTAIQIPYGSLAGLVTLDAKERGKLSFTRGIFASIGSLGVLAVKAFAFTPDPQTGKDVSWLPLIIGVSILSFFTFVFLIICYYGTKERAPVKEIKHEKGAFAKAIKRIGKNRAMLSLCIISIIVMGGDTFNGVISVFVATKFFNVTGFFTILPDLLGMLGIVFNIFVVPIFMKKFGKKETITIGLIFSSLVAFAQMFIVLMDRSASTTPYYLYVVSKFLCGLGMGFYHSLVWGLVADCCDDIQIRTGMKEDGTSYSIFMFSRKIGQCIAFVLGQFVLIVVKYYDYKSGKIPAFPDSAQRMLYILATGISLGCYVAGALLFLFWYPINKNRLEEIQDAKELMLEKEAKSVKKPAKKKLVTTSK